MKIALRNYTRVSGCTEDYFKVRAFLTKAADDFFSFARWDWMIMSPQLDRSALSRIGLWEHNGEIVGIAAFDTSLGKAFCFTLRGYEYLKNEILAYAQQHLQKDELFQVLIADTDTVFQNIALQTGYVATEEKEYVSCMPARGRSLSFRLPDGFSITTLKDTFDLARYAALLHSRFVGKASGDEGITPQQIKQLERELIRPHIDLDLRIVVVAPSGEFASCCSIWYNASLRTAVAEPVAINPAYHHMGLAKAAVYEAIRRSAALGAARILTGSMQQFYYDIGFCPHATYSWWKKGG